MFSTLQERDAYFEAMRSGSLVPEPGSWMRLAAIQEFDDWLEIPIRAHFRDCALIAIAEIKGVTGNEFTLEEIQSAPYFCFGMGWSLSGTDEHTAARLYRLLRSIRTGPDVVKTLMTTMTLDDIVHGTDTAIVALGTEIDKLISEHMPERPSPVIQEGLRVAAEHHVVNITASIVNAMYEAMKAKEREISNVPA